MSDKRILQVTILNDGTGLSDSDKAEMERKQKPDIRTIDFSIEEVMPTEVITSNPELVLEVAAAIKNAATHASIINENPPEYRRMSISSPYVTTRSWVREKFVAQGPTVTLELATYPIQVVEWDKLPQDSMIVMGLGYCTLVENIGTRNVPVREDSTLTDSPSD